MRPGLNITSEAPLLLIAAALVLVPGCLRVVRHEAPYYVEGPHQIDPPNGFFSVGKKVMVFGERDSYNRVLTSDGIAAYVWKQDLVSWSKWRKTQRQAESVEQKER